MFHDGIPALSFSYIDSGCGNDAKLGEKSVCG